MQQLTPMILLACLILSSVLMAVGDIPDVKSVDENRKLEREQTRRSVRSRRSKRGNVGKDIKNFGEEVASRIDRIVQRKAFDLWGDPWTLQGIPLIFPSGGNGFHLGLRVAIQNIKRQDPHLAQIEAQVLASDKGRFKHLVGVDFPRAFGGKFRITARGKYDRDISLKYFGIGNQTPIDFALLDQDSVLYRNIREGPSFTFQVLRYLGKYVRVGPIFGLKFTDVTVPAGSLLERDSPIGTAGGKTHYIGLAFVYDTLDFEPYPSSGGLHELYFAAYPKGFSDYVFYRTTYTFRKYWLIHRKLIFAHRTFLEFLTGEVPYYELSAAGGSDSTIGFGGDRYFRGFESNRFIDKIRMSLGFELRWDPLRFNFAGQQIKLGFVPFFTIGRVWPDAFPIRLGNWHASTGWGFRLIWNNRFVIRGDFAVTNERTVFFVELGNSF